VVQILFLKEKLGQNQKKTVLELTSNQLTPHVCQETDNTTLPLDVSSALRFK